MKLSKHTAECSLAHVVELLRQPAAGPRLLVASRNYENSLAMDRIQIAYAYGLLSYEDFRDLEIIRRLRNEAAHCIWDFSLHDSGVQEMVMQLNAAERVEQLDSKTVKNLLGVKRTLKLPKLTKAKQRLLLNGLALHDIIQRKLADAIERYLNIRKSCRALKG